MRPPRNRAKPSQARGAARARYALYMDSPAWWDRRRTWLANYRSTHNGHRPTCVVCKKPWTGRTGDLPHSTYAHLGPQPHAHLIPIYRRTHSSPRLFPPAFFSTVFSSGSNRPIRYDLIPPSVLPMVAKTSACQCKSEYANNTPTSTASDPTGSRVAARKLLVNNAIRLDCSSIITIGI